MKSKFPNMDKNIKFDCLSRLSLSNFVFSKMKVSIFGFVVILLMMFVCKGMHQGEDSSDSDESGKAVGNCEDLDFDEMMASIENFIDEDPEFINELFGKE